MNIYIEPAVFSHATQYADYVKACHLDENIDHYDEAVENSDEYLLSVVNAAEGLGLPAGYVPQATFFAVEDNRIVGAIRLRLGSNDFIEQVIGHIGYEVRPDARNRGIAKFMLNWLLARVVKGPVVISCGVDNRASQRVIEASGAQFLERRTDKTFGDIKCYRVSVT